ncbi:MAG TPA: hypothetical protein VE224_08665 [Pseudolabrys sp.]|nr:hypothetical protein [Pseudolabrys sp.]
MNFWTHIGHVPLLILLVIAATASLVLAAELHPRWGGVRDIVEAAPPGRRVVYGLGGIALLLAANAVMFLIAAFIGFGFGPLYLFVSVVVVLAIAVPLLTLPQLSQVIDGLGIWRLMWRASAIVIGCLVLAAIYIAVAIEAGLPMRFGA